MLTSSQFGAGIQIAPNASRSLHSIGVFEQFLPYTTSATSGNVRVHDSPEYLSQQRLDIMKDLFGFPFTMIHRIDLHRILYAEASKLGVEIHLGHSVVDINCQESIVKTANGKDFVGDLVICADGERSVGRNVVVERSIPSKDSGDHVFRLVIPYSKIANDPELVDLLGPSSVDLIMGPNAHAMTYYLQRDGLVNLVLIKAHDTIEDPPKLPHPVSIEDARQEFDGWLIPTKLLKVAESITRWTLLTTEFPERWVRGKTVLMGDAAHPMLPSL
jgi:salicylate hydroxylase